MKIIDILNPDRVNRKPDNSIILVSNRNFSVQGFIIKRVELHLYIEKIDENLGPYSLITSIIETDQGTIEMVYDEGFRGEKSLEKAAEFVTQNLGISSLILRSIISLKEELTKSSN
jgi:hypothetical protein